MMWMLEHWKVIGRFMRWVHVGARSLVGSKVSTATDRMVAGWCSKFSVRQSSATALKWEW